MQLVEAMTVAVRLEPGQGYLVDNHWWLHGRTRFEGPREIIRILADIDPAASGGDRSCGFTLPKDLAMRDKAPVETAL